MRNRRRWWMPMAAAVVLLTAGTWWMLHGDRDGRGGESTSRRPDVGFGIELVRIPPGRLDPEGDGQVDPLVRPTTAVSPIVIPREFWMGATEVTQKQWRAVMKQPPPTPTAADHPAHGITHEQAVEFCRKLSQKSGYRVRLPTEQEWQYACYAGAGAGAALHFGVAATTQANFSWETSWHPRLGRSVVRSAGPMPVRRFEPNAWGLYDMHGNVCEWCQDPPPPAAGSRQRQEPAGHVARGGSWLMGPADMRADARNLLAEGAACDFVGLRIVVEPK